MSAKHPIIAVTGSSGAGTTTVKVAFEHIFFRQNVNAAVIEGDSFHRYERGHMAEALEMALKDGRNLSHFSPDVNLLEKLEEVFGQYGTTGQGSRRQYLHNAQEAERLGRPVGTFTPWEPFPEKTDLLFYEGLHGAVVTETVNAARHVDLLVGVVPIINLEWIQKIHRDIDKRGYSREAVTTTILRRMEDYVNYIVPQFSLTDVNFQRVPTVDTSNPFAARDIPTPDESFVVIRFRDPAKFNIDFPYLLSMLHDSFMSRRNTIVCPAGRTGLAIEIIFGPIIGELMEKRRRALL